MKHITQINPKLYDIILDGKGIDSILQTCAKDNSFIAKCCNVFGMKVPESNDNISHAIAAYQEESNHENAESLLNAFTRHFRRIYFYDANKEAFTKYKGLNNVIDKPQYDELLQQNIMHRTVMLYNQNIHNKKAFIQSCFEFFPSTMNEQTQKNIAKAANGMHDMLSKFFDCKSSHDVSNDRKNIMTNKATKPSLTAWTLYVVTLGFAYVIDRMLNISSSSQASSFQKYAIELKNNGVQIDMNRV